MKRLKVATILGTRPELIRLSRVMSALDRHCDHLIVHTGQNYDYELSGIFFDDLGLRRPDVFLEAAGSTGAETVGNVIAASDRLLKENRAGRRARPRRHEQLPFGDRRQTAEEIPTFHMEAGNRCFDARVPEETNRRVVDHTADVNLPYSRIARDYLLSRRARPAIRHRHRQPDARGPGALPPANRCLGCHLAARPHRGRLFPGQRPSRGDDRGRGPVRRSGGDPQ